MGATGKTTNYGLPLFQPKDGTSWESFNRAMIMLDTVIANVAAESGGGGTSPDPELEEKVNQNTADIGTLQQRVTNHDHDISELKIDQSTTSQGVMKNASDIVELKSKDSELDTTIAGMQAKVDSNELGVQTLTGDYAKLEDKVEENTTEIESIKSRQSIDQASIQSLMTGLGKTEQNVKNLTTNQTELSKDVETLTSTAETLESDLTALSSQVNTNKSDIATVKQQAGDNEQGLSYLSDNIKELEEKITNVSAFRISYAQTSTRTFLWSPTVSGQTSSGMQYRRIYTINDIVNEEWLEGYVNIPKLDKPLSPPSDNLLMLVISIMYNGSNTPVTDISPCAARVDTTENKQYYLPAIGSRTNTGSNLQVSLFIDTSKIPSTYTINSILVSFDIKLK